MPSIYAHLKGKIPTQRTERDVNIVREMGKRKAATLAELTKEFNSLSETISTDTAKLKGLTQQKDAIEILIREKIDGDDMDGARLNGYTWTPTVEPYPVSDDPDAVMEYFRTHGMEDKLKLTATEIAGRLKAHVKEESLNNAFTVVEKTVIVNGEETKVMEVRSQIPGVKIFMKEKLSRQKSGSKGE